MTVGRITNIKIIVITPIVAGQVLHAGVGGNEMLILSCNLDSFCSVIHIKGATFAAISCRLLYTVTSMWWLRPYTASYRRLQGSYAWCALRRRRRQEAENDI